MQKSQHFLQEFSILFFLSLDPTTNPETKNLEFAEILLKTNPIFRQKKKHNNQCRHGTFLVGKDP
jgi:hypothetical protein